MNELIRILTTEPARWTASALCAQVGPPDLWFPDKGGNPRSAKAVCARCDVRADCLEEALAADERFGVFGGLTVRQRRALSVDVAS